jgi:hypothetical protein
VDYQRLELGWTHVSLSRYGLAGNKVVLADNVGTTEVTWALGAMIARANLIPADGPSASTGSKTVLSPLQAGDVAH